MAVCQEKLGDPGEARKGYQAYLKILPQGPFAEEAHRAIERLSPPEAGNGTPPDKNSAQK